MQQRMRVGVEALRQGGAGIADPAAEEARVGPADLLAQDSAQDVYALAMDQLDIDRRGVHPSAFRSILEVWMAGRGRKARGGEPLAAVSRPAASPRAEVA